MLYNVTIFFLDLLFAFIPCERFQLLLLLDVQTLFIFFMRNVSLQMIVCEKYDHVKICGKNLIQKKKKEQKCFANIKDQDHG